MLRYASEPQLLWKDFQRDSGAFTSGIFNELPYGKATELLKLTQLSISEISNAVGYANPLHFSRAFKNVYGESPRIWRQNHRT
ncbi:helix-turn-helix domain-containing protein [Faecalimonas umbilicata]|uniref:helix-turn-helix domain-containing protein n=1 Tax=Faecalimonas umbilicata TaxID=1912855 RepID=UPI003995A759